MKRRYDNNCGSRKDEYHCYYLVGIIVVTSSIVYVIYYIRLFFGGQSGVHYTLFMVFAIGTFAGVEIIISLRGIITTRRLREPILEAIKWANLVSSMISLALMQTAIVPYSGRSGDSNLKSFGVFLGVFSAFIGLNMIINMRRIINGKNHASMIKKANMIAKRNLPGLIVEAVKYEDNGPGERFIYISNNHDDATFRIIKVAIESKMNLEVKQLRYRYLPHRDLLQQKGEGND